MDFSKTEVDQDQQKRELEITKHTLNALFHQILIEMEQSDGDISFIAPVKFASSDGQNQVSLDSLPAKAVAQIIPELVKEGKLLIGVEPAFTGPVSSVSQCSFMNGNQPAEAKFIGCMFPSNFFTRCVAENVQPETIVRKAIADIVHEDALMTAQKSPRAVVRRKPGDDLVVIYSGPALSQE